MFARPRARAPRLGARPGEGQRERRLFSARRLRQDSGATVVASYDPQEPLPGRWRGTRGLARLPPQAERGEEGWRGKRGGGWRREKRR